MSSLSLFREGGRQYRISRKVNNVAMGVVFINVEYVHLNNDSYTRHAPI